MSGIVVFGALKFVELCLTTLDDLGLPISGVGTVDMAYKAQSNMASDYFADLEPWCAAGRVPFREFPDSGASADDWVAQLQPDWLLALGWPHMVTARVRERARFGALGTHASLLPKRRGGAPLNWAILDGLSATGMTILRLADGIDSGPIAWQTTIAIEQTDTIGDVLDRAGKSVIDGLRQIAPGLRSGNVPLVEQNHSQATWTRRRTDADGRIRWSSTALQIHNLVRALAPPFPGAWTELRTQRIRVLELEPVQGVRPAKQVPGTVLSLEPGLLIQTGDYCVRLRTVASPQPVAAEKWAERVGITPGDVLGSEVTR